MWSAAVVASIKGLHESSAPPGAKRGSGAHAELIKCEVMNNALYKSLVSWRLMLLCDSCVSVEFVCGPD